MQEGEIITLENNNDYLLLLKNQFNNNYYFLAVLLDKTEQPTKNYKLFQEINENNDTFIQEINDPILLNTFINQYQKM